MALLPGQQKTLSDACLLSLMTLLALATPSCTKWSHSADADVDADHELEPDGDADSDADSDGDADSDADGDADSDGDADADSDADEDLDSRPDADGEVDGEVDSALCDDGLCDEGESLCSCPSDCDVCGDGLCSLAEVTGETCAEDCEDGLGVWIALCGGTFQMGSPLSELGRYDNEHPHEVTLTRGFAIQSTEVTQSQFLGLMSYNPSWFLGCDSCPVEGLSWHEAAAYCNALSDAEGLEGCFACTGFGERVSCEPSPSFESPYDCPGFRMPTEAELEYAARAGTTTATYDGELDSVSCDSDVADRIAWNCGNSGDHTHEVGLLSPNPWGLYDLLGNVWEWSWDWYVVDLGGDPVVDPSGPPDDEYRSARGGSYFDSACDSRAASRVGSRPGSRQSHQGFRPARTLEP